MEKIEGPLPNNLVKTIVLMETGLSRRSAEELWKAAEEELTRQRRYTSWSLVPHKREIKWYDDQTEEMLYLELQTGILRSRITVTHFRVDGIADVSVEKTLGHNRTHPERRSISEISLRNQYQEFERAHE